MSGSIRQHKPGSWLLRVDIDRDPVTGKRRQMSRVVHGTRRQAERELDDFKIEIRSRGPVTSSMTLTDLFERWLTTLTKSGRKRTSVSVYNTRLRFSRYVQPSMGNRAISDIKSSEITLLLDGLIDLRGLSPATAGRVRGELRAMLNWAWRRDLIAENPAIRAEVPTVPLRPPTTLTCEELCEHLDLASREDPELELVMMVAASLGLRRSEIAALKWSHVDFKKGFVHIREALTKAPGSDYETTPTKTGLHGFAEFPLHPGLLQRLQERHELFTSRLRELGEADITDGYIFTCDPAGQLPLHPDTLTRAFRKHRSRHPELPSIGLQVLRRYAGSDLFGQGEDQVIASAILRDTPETTARHYRAVRQASARHAVIGIFERIETQRDALDNQKILSR